MAWRGVARRGVARRGVAWRGLMSLSHSVTSRSRWRPPFPNPPRQSPLLRSFLPPSLPLSLRTFHFDYYLPVIESSFQGNTNQEEIGSVLQHGAGRGALGAGDELEHRSCQLTMRLAFTRPHPVSYLCSSTSVGGPGARALGDSGRCAGSW